MLDQTLFTIRKFIPKKIFNFFNPFYHLSLAYLAAYHYHFPSREINVIAITGTKGKSTTSELVNAFLEKAGYKTAISNTIRYKVGDVSKRNLFKMSTPGRFFLQRLLRQAVRQGCQYAIIEMTSQGALLFRHRFIDLDTLIFTNLTPEHIEAHGSYENYRQSKLSIAENMKNSCKSLKTIIANADDSESKLFLACQAQRKISYSIHDAEPYKATENGLEFTYDGRPIRTRLQGLFNLYNIVSAITCAKNEGVQMNDIIYVLENILGIPGRVEKIEAKDFTVIVDYAHTADSLEKLYQTFKDKKIIAVLGGTGGGRDIWKRSKMGRIADTYCREIILTDEDPYDEDPMQIIRDVAGGIKSHKPEIIIDRRLAIRKALEIAPPSSIVLITGKGTDPYIMGPNNTKTPWSDAQVVKEELEKIGLKK